MGFSRLSPKTILFTPEGAVTSFATRQAPLANLIGGKSLILIKISPQRYRIANPRILLSYLIYAFQY